MDDDGTTTAPEAAPPTDTQDASTTPETPDLSGILKTDGVLTVGAEPPAPPFIIPPYPDNPTGFEVDIAKEIQERLGIPETKFIEFVWTNLFSPAPKPFDFDINETTITDERDEVVDFSDPYFEANQAILVHTGLGRRGRDHSGRHPGPPPRRAGHDDRVSATSTTRSSRRRIRGSSRPRPPRTRRS